MYLAIDVGATKTLVASLNDEGVINQKLRFPTPASYDDFISDLSKNVANLSTKKFKACGIGVPGRIDRLKGTGIAMGNLPWEHIDIDKDVSSISNCPVAVENDANLAGLSEAMLLKHRYSKVLYVTISTGIGTGFIVDQTIEQSVANSEGGHVIVEHNGKTQTWESLISGRSIVKRYGKKAQDIQDAKTWSQIAHEIALGLIDLITILQPEAIVFGGSVGVYFDRFDKALEKALKHYETPLIPIPPLLPAGRPEEAVLYGCYDLAKATYAGSTR